MPAAAYEIAVPTPGSDWPLTIVTRPGETVNIKVESLRARQGGGGESNFERDTDTLAAINIGPAQARREHAGTRYLQSEVS